MDRVCIALVDATLARFFAFDRGTVRHLADEPRPRGKHEIAFARMAMAAFRELIDEHDAQRAIVCANAPMLGQLRAAAPGILPDQLPIDALACDFVQLPSAEIRAKLADHGLLPARAR
jgi:hypothetical protein